MTAIANPRVWFQGRFQARFATESDYYNDGRGNSDPSLLTDPDTGRTLADYNALPPADQTGTPAGRNLATRIAFLGGDPEAGIDTATRRTLWIGYHGKEQFIGLINDDMTSSRCSAHWT